MAQKKMSHLSISRLSRRIVFWVFISVIAIEALIFIPSFKKREKELLLQVKEISLARVAFIMQIVPPEAPDAELFKYIQKLYDGRTVIGGALYRTDGKKVGTFGEMPGLSIADVSSAGMTFFFDRKGSRYDIACSPAELKRKYRLILRHDASSVTHRLYAFFFRIAGLVVIISLFVTGGTWLTLHWIVVNPILNLRHDLIRAGDALSQDQDTPEFYSAKAERNDELGEVIGAFRRMYQQISDANARRKKAEAALQHSFQQVQSYSRMLNGELEKGRQMQVNFLPAHLLQLPGWETAAFFKPARQVAGDFYDLFELPGGKVGIVIADVCDKGVGAALFMALFRSLIRIFSGQTALNGLPLTCSDIVPDNPAAGGGHPDIDAHDTRALQAVALTNSYIALNHGDLAMFATLFFGILEPDSGALSYINGGHESLFIVAPGGGIKARLAATGPAVGIQTESSFGIRQSRLDPGDLLLGYTDGIIEASAADRTFFTRDRLVSMLGIPVVSAADLLDRIANRVQEHIGKADQFDDITLVAIRRTP
jgi:serine phosphatase RsbU (regulator of sigma subunit)